jgi:hypothetical protein
MILLQRAFALLLAGAAVIVTVPLGCRNVIGIPQLGSDQLTCDTYCDTIGTACTGPQLQYASRAACMALCPTFPVGTLADTSGNTLGCRLNVATTIAGDGEASCTAAGPGGAGPGSMANCGTDCESFCASAVQVCPKDFTSEAACRLLCAPIPECPPYTVVPGAPLPDANTIQCRLYHLTSAALDPATHCPHVAGFGFCTPSSPPCMAADGG